MVVQHNMQAANANRMLNVTTSAQSKSTLPDHQSCPSYGKSIPGIRTVADGR